MAFLGASFPSEGETRTLCSDVRGVVYVEFLTAFMPLLLTFLGITQLSLLKVGQMVVQHAANRAARAAVVILEDAPEHHGDAARGDLTGGNQKSSNSILRFLDDVGSSYATLVQDEEAPAGSRLKKIRRAGYHALAVLAPTPAHYLSKKRTLHGAVGASPWGRIAGGFLAYGGAASAITLHANGSKMPATQIARHDALTVRVAFLMPCLVPLAASVMCVHGHDLAQARLGFSSSEKYDAINEAMTLVESPIRRDLNLAFGGHFALISAEATLPNQGADYVEGL